MGALACHFETVEKKEKKWLQSNVSWPETDGIALKEKNQVSQFLGLEF